MLWLIDINQMHEGLSHSDWWINDEALLIGKLYYVLTPLMHWLIDSWARIYTRTHQPFVSRIQAFEERRHYQRRMLKDKRWHQSNRRRPLMMMQAPPRQQHHHHRRPQKSSQHQQQLLPVVPPQSRQPDRRYVVVIVIHYYFFFVYCLFFSTKKRQHFLTYWKAFFVRHSSEYETPDNDQKVIHNIYSQMRIHMVRWV